MMTAAALPEALASDPVPPPTIRTVLGDSAPASSFTATQPPRRNPPSVSNGRLQVFVDPSNSDAPPEIQTNPWPELGVRKVRVKENVPEVKKMSGTTIKQPGRSARIATGTASGSRTASQIVPYRDPDLPKSKKIPPPSMVTQRSKKTVAPKTPAKTIVVFQDGDGDGNGNGNGEVSSVPCTPKFIPFCDEVRFHVLIYFFMLMMV